MDSEEFSELMAEETAKWDQLGVNIGSYKPSEGFLGLIFRFETLNNILKEKGIITEEEMDEEFRRVSLSGLKMVRETVIEPAVQKAKEEAIRQSIVRPGNGLPPNMKIPKKPKKH